MKYVKKMYTREFIIYVIVGFSTFFLDYLLYWLLIEKLHIWYLAAQSMLTPLVLIFNYTSHRLFTFQSGGARRIQVPRYLMLAVFNYGMSVALLYVFVDIVGLHYLMGKVLTTGLIVMYNFFALKRLVFASGEVPTQTTQES